MQKHYSTEVTDSNLNYVLTLNDNINNSKEEYSPRSITSNSNFFNTEKNPVNNNFNNLNTSENDLALQSHRITESIKNIMNSNNVLNYPDLSNYYNTISFINTDDDANSSTNKNNNINVPNSAKNSDMKLNKNNFTIDNKRISFKNIEDVPIITGENIINSIKNDKNKLNSNNGKNVSLINSNNNSNNKNILLNKKNQYSQKTISNKNDLANITSKFKHFLKKNFILIEIII